MSVIPEYGNYGGLGHSGEGYDPVTGEIKSYVLKPIDKLDECFYRHDHA
jgi:hypothetical protein